MWRKLMYAMIKSQLAKSVPFAQHAQVEIIDLKDGEAQARLPFEKELCNHIGTLHAAALFAAGETASGAAMAGAFMPIILKVTPVAADAHIRYIKPAKTAVTATAQVIGDSDALRTSCKADGKVQFQIKVRLSDEKNQDVAEMDVSWHVRYKS